MKFSKHSHFEQPQNNRKQHSQLTTRIVAADYKIISSQESEDPTYIVDSGLALPHEAESILTSDSISLQCQSNDTSVLITPSKGYKLALSVTRHGLSETIP